MRLLITAGLLLAAVLAGCNKAELVGGAEIRGTVVDIRGEAIPGVVVSLPDPLTQCLTNALGGYKIATEPGQVTLHFMKTGYTSGTMVIENVAVGVTVARPLSLWCLPQTSGLFLFEDFKYRRTAAMKPRPYVASEDQVIYGVGKLTDIVETQTPQPLLMCYKMPSYDAKLCKLKQTQAAMPESPTLKEDVWISGDSVPLAMAPVDEPERLLWEVRLMGPLDPGVYALQWGALDGFTTTDERMFVFAVAQPSGESSVPAEAAAPEGAEKEKAPAATEEKKKDEAPAATKEQLPDEAPDEAATDTPTNAAPAAKQ